MFSKTWPILCNKWQPLLSEFLSARKIGSQVLKTFSKVIPLNVRIFLCLGLDNPLSRRFYFTVSNSNFYQADDAFAPKCYIKQNNIAENCANYTFPNVCHLQSWVGEVDIEDVESGLHSIETVPEFHENKESYTQYDNFIIGTNDRVQFFVKTTCCAKTVQVRIQDLDQNEEICQLGNSKRAPKSLNPNELRNASTGIIVAIVAIVICILVIIGGVFLYIRIRNRRAAELSEMRSVPQAR